MTNKNYTIDFVDPTKSTLDIVPDTIDGPNGTTASTDIDLIGMGKSVWGEQNLENLIHILENFSCEEDMHDITSMPSSTTFMVSGDVRNSFVLGVAINVIETISGNVDSFFVSNTTPTTYDSNTDITTITIQGSLTNILPAKAGNRDVPNKSLKYSPNKPLQGQLWYNQTISQINVWDGSWARVGGISIAAIAPANPSNGDLWWDTSIANRQLKIFVSLSWKNVVEDFLLRDGTLPMTGNLDLNGNKIVNIANPSSPGDVLLLGFVDPTYVKVSGDTMTGVLTLGLDPVNPLDAATMQYVDTRLKKDGSEAMTGVLDMGGNNIKSTYIPVLDDDVVNVKYYNANQIATTNPWPIGSVYISMVNVNPATTFGGTWVQVALGRTLIGYDINNSLFNAVGDGAIGSYDSVNVTHSHAITTNGNHNHIQGRPTHESGAQYGTVSGNSMVEANTKHVTATAHPYTNSSGSHSHFIFTSGVSGNNLNLTPYFVTYIWHRTG